RPCIVALMMHFFSTTMSGQGALVRQDVDIEGSVIAPEPPTGRHGQLIRDILQHRRPGAAAGAQKHRPQAGLIGRGPVRVTYRGQREKSSRRRASRRWGTARSTF